MNNKQPALRVQYVSPDTLKPATYNPRRWDQAAVRNLTESIKSYGLVDPILVNAAPKRKGIVIGGHFRLKIAKDLGYDKVPVVYVNIPSLKREQELNLRLNRNTGDWDFELLKEFDLDLVLDVGFDDGDLAAMWDSTSEIEEDNFDLDRATAAIKRPKTKSGDLYQLGNHRLLCADSTDTEAVKRLVGTTKPSMIYCDPPYNINLSYSDGLTTKAKYQGTTNDKLTPKAYEYLLERTLQNALGVASKDVHVFFWCDEANIALVQQLYERNKLKNRRVCLWIKNNFNMTPQVAFNKAYEPCVYATRGKPYLASSVTNLSEILNKEVASGNRQCDDVLDLLNIWVEKRVAAQAYEHPTQKPVTLHEKPLRRCTKPGDYVLDLFGGSGSTLIACEQLGRRALLCEIDPVFCDVIISRFEQLTGRHAKKIN